MQISSIASSLTDTLSLGKKTNPAATAAALSAQSPDAASTSPAARKALASILSKYDVTDITPENYSHMLQELFQAGALNDQEFQQLSAIRPELENAGIKSNESVNLLEFYQEKVRSAQQQLDPSLTPAAAKQQMSPMLNRQAWLEKFSLIHANPDAVGMDLAA